MAGICFEETPIPGLLIIRPRASHDPRGSFVKTFAAAAFADAGLATRFAEEYHTCSRRHVVRGMHFQQPPHDHEKTVFCTYGEVFDVVLDLRVGSPTFGLTETFTLSGSGGHGLYIPSGCAHGFCSTTDAAVLAYKVTTAYAPASDAGVLWSSFPVNWPCAHPVVSQRDSEFTSLADLDSPFVFRQGEL